MQGLVFSYEGLNLLFYVHSLEKVGGGGHIAFMLLYNTMKASKMMRNLAVESVKIKEKETS